ncbi:MAG TPA: serine/threonine-protein kinase, partial [Polyangium sp.]|nr:serine/threonine-protein kinase [Polyangium sp.]
AVGKYKFIASLGGGGMADVYLAVVEGPARVTKLQVVKRLRRDYLDDPDHVEMFLDEARLAARLNHPNVVQTFEVSESEGEYFLAMEYLDGVPFNRILNRARNKPPPPGVLLKILADTLLGLHYAHELTEYDGQPLHIVHRDVSPHNIVVTYEGQTKLLDFGIAKSEARSIETRAGVVKGKISYMSPEQARAKPLDRRADIFVVGILLWESMAGTKIWEKATDMEVLHRLALGDMPDLRDVRPDTPEAILKIIKKAFHPDPEGRYDTAAQMREDILAYLDSANIRVTNEVVAEYVCAVFADKRAEIKKIIEKQLRKLTVKQPAEDVPGLLDLSTPLESLTDPADLPRVGGSGVRSLPGAGSSNSDSHPSHQSNSAHSGGKSTSAPVAQSDSVQFGAAGEGNGRSRGGLYAVAAIALFASLGAFLYLRNKAATDHVVPPVKPSVWVNVTNSAPTPSAPAPTPSAPPSASAVPAMVASQAPSAESPDATPPQQTTVELRVTVIPENATVYLDGAKLPSNPFTGKFPVDKIGHRLEASAPEHRPLAQFVLFEKDSQVELKLEPRPGTPAYREWIRARQAEIAASAKQRLPQPPPRP